MIVERSNDEEASEDWAIIAGQHDGNADAIRDLNGKPADMPLTQWILVRDA